MLFAVRRNGFALRFATPELRGDRDIVIAAFDENSWAVQYASWPLLDSDIGFALPVLRGVGRRSHEAFKQVRADWRAIQ